MITDLLPENVQLAGEIISTEAITTQGLQFNLGDVPAGYQTRVRYPIRLSEDLRDGLLAPVIGWDVRP